MDPSNMDMLGGLDGKKGQTEAGNTDKINDAIYPL